MQQVAPGRASQTTDVYERLRADILAAEYLPDQKLKINELCDQLQGNLGAVREALSRLLADGLVVSVPFKGFQVAPVSAEDLISLTEARIEIEKLCLASSLANGDLAWEGRIVALLHQLLHSSPDESAEARKAWTRVHTAFHDALVSACNNSWLLRMHRMLHEQSERYRRLAFVAYAETLMKSSGPRDTATEHRMLAEAAIARDAERAGAIVAEHLQRTSEHLLAQLQVRSTISPIVTE